LVTRQDVRPVPEPGALPAYLRIAERLTIEIGAGRLAPGDRLPPERRMAGEAGVSMMTLRKALAVVAERGLIERRQGSGNYVRQAERNVGTYALFRLEAVPHGGGLPTARVLSFARETAASPDHPDGSWRIRRIRALDGVPAAVEEIRLDARFGPLRAEQLSESLYRTYADRFGLVIGHAEDRVSAAPLPGWAPADLEARPGDMMGLVERRSFDQNARLAETSRTWFHPARARYAARVP
jgi:GntR family transcriptional regulator